MYFIIEMRTSTITHHARAVTYRKSEVALLILSKKPRIGSRAETWSVTLDAGLRSAGASLRWGRRLRAAASTLPVPVLCAAIYVAVARFTLLDIPRWPVLLLFVVWLLGLSVWSLRQRVTSADAARYLDRKLQLDERITTCVEIINSSRVARSRRVVNSVSYALFTDAAEALDHSLHLLPHPFRLSLSRPRALAIAGTVLCLMGVLLAPTNVDLLRSEKGELSQSVQQQLAEIASLKTSIGSNQQLSADLKKSLVGELSDLQSKLSDPRLDQAVGIAALADSEQRLRSLLQTPSSDFDALVAAAQTVWNAVASNIEWDPSQAVSSTDLGRASEATQFLAGQVSNLDTTQERRLASSVDRGSSYAAARDVQLGKELGEGAAGIRTRDRGKAAQALTDAAQRFASADREREGSLALEGALSKLNKGREQIAQVGKPAAKKAQVGFRQRGAAPGSQPPQTASGTPGAQGDPQADKSGDQSGNTGVGAGRTIGNNAPAYGGPQPGGQTNGPSTGQPSANNGQGNGPSGSSNVAGGNGKGAQSGDGGGAKSGSSGSAGGSSNDNGQTGQLQGQVNGPVGGTSGAISQVKNPAGSGAGGSGGAQPGSASNKPGETAGTEQVYVPGKPAPAGESGAGNLPGEASPPSAQTGEAGRSNSTGDSGEQSTGGPVGGAIMPVHTPYKEVIGQYAKQATDALERAYIPPDAKDYVRDYFSGLGK